MLRYIYIIAGTICVIIGAIGAFVPLLPTTPLLLLAAWLYIRSSDRLYNWLLNQKILGSYIRDFMEEKAIPKRAKIVALVMMWASILFCIHFIAEPIWLKFLLAIATIAISLYIMSFKSK